MDGETIAVGDECRVMVGQVLAGKYRVERLLGEGGMGVVLAVYHLTLGQLFALKVLAPGKSVTEEHRARFAREARAAARLGGQHVVRVVDSGELNDEPFSSTPFLVMEFVAGQDLAEVLEREGALLPEIAVRYTLQACEALAEAHSRGLVHRDLKPSNLLLCEASDGTPHVKLLDFGISKLDEEFQPSLTTSQSVMGTPRYMAPEQMRSARDVDPRADLWALGVILYEMLSGVVPFDGETLVELVLAVQQKAPLPLREVSSGVAPGLAEIVHQLLEKDRERRFPNAAALATALGPYAPADEMPRIPRIQRMLARAGGSEKYLPTAAASSGMLPELPPSSRSGEFARSEQSTVGPRAAGPAVGARSTDRSAKPFPFRTATAVGFPSLDGTRSDAAEVSPANIGDDEPVDALPVAKSRAPLAVMLLTGALAAGAGFYLMKRTPAPPTEPPKAVDVVSARTAPSSAPSTIPNLSAIPADALPLLDAGGSSVDAGTDAGKAHPRPKGTYVHPTGSSSGDPDGLGSQH